MARPQHNSGEDVMGQIIEYQLEEKIAVVSIDDGKANAVSSGFVAELNEALDRAEHDEAVVVLTGRPRIFSSGFDLNVLKQGGDAALNLVRSGARLAVRMLGFPSPLIIACNGHALAMGSLLLLSADLRIGVSGDYKIGLNEVAIGRALPSFGVEIARARMSPVHFARSVANAEIFTPGGALEVGFLDKIVEKDQLMATAWAHAQLLSKLDMIAHHTTKLRARQASISRITEAIELEFQS